MRGERAPVTTDVVLVGAGHAHVGVIRAFGMKPMPGVRVTLVTRQVHTPYSGMLPGLIAGVYGHDETHIDTAPLCSFAGARLYRSEVIGLDLAARRIICRDRPPVPYDILSIDIGSTPSARDVPGAGAHAIPVKPIDGFIDRFEAVRARVLAASGKARIGVVGGGAGGVELLLALHRRLARDVRAAGHDPAGLTFTLVTSTATLLPAFPRRVGLRFTEIMGERGITVVTGGRAERIEAGGLHVAGKGFLALDHVFWTTKAAAAPWLAKTGLALDREGFIRVGATLQSVSHPEVFAAGDVATMDGYAHLPKSGVYAVRAGPPLTANIRALAAGKSLTRHKPQRDALYLLTTGGRHAVGARNGFTFEGEWVWRLKDWIDTRFMRRFAELPDMAGAEAPAGDGGAAAAEAMRCGGCGGKIGASVLRRALRGVDRARRDDVVAGLEAPDDAALIDTGGVNLSVQTVDYFKAPFDDPYLLGRIAANHALGDIYAMGAKPQTALAIATLPHGPAAKTEADLADMMRGAGEVLSAAGAALVGGHTSEGADLALGFAVNGLVARGAALRKGGLQPGDALILTKAIGTGAIIAAHMRGKARARWLMAAIDVMSQSSREAAAILRAHGARAMTDITGFGLIGHLGEMVEASGIAATLSLTDVPLIGGASDVLAAGIVSSLHAENVKLTAHIANRAEAEAHPHFAALLDPQTAGGLLAGVAAERAAACITALHAAGYTEAAVIGRVEARGAKAEPITVTIAPAQAASETTRARASALA